MSAERCCHCSPSPRHSVIALAGAPSARGRVRAIGGWLAPLLPATMLAVMPKCPMCLAAYVAIGAGVGLSAQAAAQLRWTLVILCVVSLTYLIARRLRCLGAKWHSPRSLP
jgi:hypothetical protein